MPPPSRKNRYSTTAGSTATMEYGTVHGTLSVAVTVVVDMAIRRQLSLQYTVWCGPGRQRRCTRTRRVLIRARYRRWRRWGTQHEIATYSRRTRDSIFGLQTNIGVKTNIGRGEKGVSTPSEHYSTDRFFIEEYLFIIVTIDTSIVLPIKALTYTNNSIFVT